VRSVGPDGERYVRTIVDYEQGSAIPGEPLYRVPDLVQLAIGQALLAELDDARSPVQGRAGHIQVSAVQAADSPGDDAQIEVGHIRPVYPAAAPSARALSST
jgi:hypothetical protein